MTDMWSMVISVLLAGILTDNMVLSKFLGICPFLGVSKKLNTAFAMSVAVTLVMLLATAVTWPLYAFVLVPLGIDYLQTIAVILVIAALVQLVEILLKKFLPPIYKALGIYLPLITTNCAILGVAIMVIQKNFTLIESLVFAIATAIGFALALVLFAGLRERLSMVKLPKAMQGMPTALITAGLLAMAFMGFSGVV